MLNSKIKKTIASEAVGLFIHTDKAHKRVCERKIKELKLHRSQHIMLMHLARFERPVSQKELAQSISITPAAATVSIKKLIREGVVERKTSSKDLRYNEVSISEKGKQIVKRSKEIFREIDNEMVKGISEDELLTFISILKRMRQNLDSSEKLK